MNTKKILPYLVGLILLSLSTCFLMSCRLGTICLNSDEEGVSISDTNAPMITKVFKVEPFRALEAGSAFSYTLIPSEKDSVWVVMNKAFEPYFECKVMNQKLSFGFDRSVSLRNNSLPMPKVFIMFKQLDNIIVNGAASASVSGIYDGQKKRTLGIEVSGAAKLEGNFTNFNACNMDLSGACNVKSSLSDIPTVVCRGSGSVNFQGDMARVDDFLCEGTGASDIRMTGFARKCNLSLSGSSDFAGKNFSTEELNADLSGASDATLQVKNGLKAETSGASDLKIIGNPKSRSVSSSGASSITIKE